MEIVKCSIYYKPISSRLGRKFFICINDLHNKQLSGLAQALHKPFPCFDLRYGVGLFGK